MKTINSTEGWNKKIGRDVYDCFCVGMWKHYKTVGEMFQSNVSTCIKVVSTGTVFGVCASSTGVQEAVYHVYVGTMLSRNGFRAPPHTTSSFCTRHSSGDITLPQCAGAAPAGSTASVTKCLRCCYFLRVLFLRRVCFDFEWHVLDDVFLWPPFGHKNTNTIPVMGHTSP